MELSSRATHACGTNLVTGWSRSLVLILAVMTGVPGLARCCLVAVVVIERDAGGQEVGRKLVRAEVQNTPESPLDRDPAQSISGGPTEGAPPARTASQLRLVRQGLQVGLTPCELVAEQDRDDGAGLGSDLQCSAQAKNAE